MPGIVELEVELCIRSSTNLVAAAFSTSIASALFDVFGSFSVHGVSVTLFSATIVDDGSASTLEIWSSIDTDSVAFAELMPSGLSKSKY